VSCRITTLVAVLFAAVLPAMAASAWPPADGRGSCTVTKETNIEARMRDGVILRADVYRPRTAHPVPVILMRTQYGKEAAQVRPSRFQTSSWFAAPQTDRLIADDYAFGGQ